MGVVFARGLNGPKARIRLIVGLKQRKKSCRVKRIFGTVTNFKEKINEAV